MPTHNIPPHLITKHGPPLTPEEFLEEYNKGGELGIDLDPRIDFTKPVMEQVLKLEAEDKETLARTSQKVHQEEAA